MTHPVLFGTLLVAATVLYIIAMILLARAYRKSARKMAEEIAALEKKQAAEAEKVPSETTE